MPISLLSAGARRHRAADVLDGLLNGVLVEYAFQPSLPENQRAGLFDRVQGAIGKITLWKRLKSDSKLNFQVAEIKSMTPPRGTPMLTALSVASRSASASVAPTVSERAGSRIARCSRVQRFEWATGP